MLNINCTTSFAFPFNIVYTGICMAYISTMHLKTQFDIHVHGCSKVIIMTLLYNAYSIVIYLSFIPKIGFTLVNISVFKKWSSIDCYSRSKTPVKLSTLHKINIGWYGPLMTICKSFKYGNVMYLQSSHSNVHPLFSPYIIKLATHRYSSSSTSEHGVHNIKTSKADIQTEIKVCV